MQGATTQIMFRVPKVLLREIDAAAKSTGFSSRGAYFMHLHHVMQTVHRLTIDEMELLLRMTVWGERNFRQTPSLKKVVAGPIGFDIAWARKTVARFVSLGLVENMGATQGGPFQFDFTDGELRFQVTQPGLAASQVALMEQRSMAVLRQSSGRRR